MATAASTYHNLKSKRTEAVAPRTLFGSNMEIMKKGSSAQTYPTHQKPKKPTKAEQYVRFQQPDDVDRLTDSKMDYYRQWHATHHAKNKLQEVETNALYFHPSPHSVGRHRVGEQFHPAHITDNNPYRTDTKLTATDVAHPELFNTTGLGGRADYNYDMYRHPKLRDNSDYTLSGNVFGRGGQFSAGIGGRTGPGARQKCRQGEYQSPIIQSAKQEPMRRFRMSNDEIPPNIRHKYGNQVIRDLIGEDQEIKEALKALSPEERSARRLSHGKSRQKHSPGYESLSNNLRYDHFSGVPHRDVQSLNTESYNEEQFKKSTQSYPPKFGVMKNADSKWNEDNVIRDRLKRAWDATIGKPKESALT